MAEVFNLFIYNSWSVVYVGRSEVPTQRDRPAQSASLHVSLKGAVSRVSCLTEANFRRSESDFPAKFPASLSIVTETVDTSQ